MRKRVIAVILSLMLAAPIAGVGLAHANTTRVSYSFSFGAQPNLEHTSVRQKDSYSSVYMKVTQLPTNKSYIAGIWGRTSLSDTTDRATNPSTPAYYFSGVDTWYNMTNYVKESGFPCVVVRAAQNASFSFNASGQWSADI
jgi:hypothetical protein